MAKLVNIILKDNEKVFKFNYDGVFVDSNGNIVDRKIATTTKNGRTVRKPGYSFKYITGSNCTEHTFIEDKDGVASEVVMAVSNSDGITLAKVWKND